MSNEIIYHEITEVSHGNRVVVTQFRDGASIVTLNAPLGFDSSIHLTVNDLDALTDAFRKAMDSFNEREPSGWRSPIDGKVAA